MSVEQVDIAWIIGESGSDGWLKDLGLVDCRTSVFAGGFTLDAVR